MTNMRLSMITGLSVGILLLVACNARDVQLLESLDEEGDVTDGNTPLGEQCADGQWPCSDPGGDHCTGTSRAVATGCEGYDMADIISVTASCDGGDLTVTTTMAGPIDISPGAFEGRLQTTLNVLSTEGFDLLQLSAISDDGQPFDDFAPFELDDDDRTVVDAQGRLVQTLTAASIAQHAGEGTHILVDTFLALDADSGYKWDETEPLLYPCSASR